MIPQFTSEAVECLSHNCMAGQCAMRMWEEVRVLSGAWGLDEVVDTGMENLEVLKH